jgi:hypothetical protein
LGPLAIAWHKRAGSGLGSGVSDLQSAVVDNRIVLVGTKDSGDEFASAIWWEENLDWQAATLPESGVNVQLRSVVSGGPGAMVVGWHWGANGHAQPLIWTSADGKVWDAVDTSAMGEGQLERIGVVSGGFVTWVVDLEDESVGRLWTSPDGTHWSDADSAFLTGQPMVLIGAGATFTMLDAEVPELTADPAPYSVLRASAPDTWQKVGELPDSVGAFVDAAAVGPLGWVAVGARDAQNMAWTSADGQTWQVAPSAPSSVSHIFGDAAGFIGVGYYNTGTGCALSELDNVGVTWTSNDGRVWVLVNEMKAEWIDTLRRRNRTLIGIGSSFKNGGYYRGTTWTASLPDVANVPLPNPTPSPTPAPTEPGCGGG